MLATGAATGSWEPAGHDGGLSYPGPVPGARQAVAPADPAGDAARLVSRSGDRWSAAYSPQEYEAFRRSLEGEYIGTGITLRRTPAGRIEVSGVHPGSPADEAGVTPGDILLTVDGESVDGVPVTEAVARLRGSDRPEAAGPGSTVLLGLERDGEPREVPATRARLSIEPVTVSREADGVTRIHLSSFTAGSAERLRAAVREAAGDEGILLDLRGNSGGLLTEAARAASVFLDGGLVATYDVHGSQRALHAERGGDTRTPLVVLVDAGTMSSAEMLTGVLQDRNRAVVVGSRTFGKGTVQMPREQPDGSVAELTVGHYVMPSGAVVEEHGLVPDVVVGPGEDAETRARTVLSGLATGR
ncbi:S41 family peptidase [Streptomyces sodiiphilus]|uniref:S41 family peptidase n=1 Tax=Streptomyces sodiiphilus TaxID=226217 RepID=A0ABN2PU61_9ACTN